jgi:Macrocin-O-methyltransferase (TylF)
LVPVTSTFGRDFPVTSKTDLTDAYLDLMKKALSASLYPQARMKIAPMKGVGGAIAAKLMRNKKVLPVDFTAFTENEVEEGRVWGMLGFTMVGHKRLDNVRSCIEEALKAGVPGDLVETGVWKGGTSIFMRAVLKAHAVTDRLVWAADSFEGLPVPKDKDDGADLSKVEELKVSLEEVQANFARFDLLDDQVKFLKGWFADTLPTAPIDKIAVLRLDGDLYSSTMDALVSLYDRVSPGGYIIADDYYSWESCRRAVHDFLNTRGERPEIKEVDWTGAFWQVS